MEYEFARTDTSDQALAAYARLFVACFPSARHLTDISYLTWLYRDNPAGPVVGFDAFHGGQLAAHYVCIPAAVTCDGRPQRALLSLNTATHPDHQGKGLFTKLAERTYAAGAAEGFALVYGVANANSTPGFIRKLGFDNVSPLEARVGAGPLLATAEGIDPAKLQFGHLWDRSTLEWRVGCPRRNLRLSRSAKDDMIGVSGAVGRPAIRAWAELPLSMTGGWKAGNLERAPLAARLWLGLLPESTRMSSLYKSIPDRFRPSPLNFIVRGLTSELKVDRDGTFFSFLDFDAY